jgi:hypothetical protein
MPLGNDGLWGTVNAVWDEALEVADQETGNVAWFGIVEEHGNPAYLAARIKVEGGEITEVETVVNRLPDMPKPFGNPEAIVHDPAFSAVLPPAERRSRERLIAVADGYFTGLQKNDGKGINGTGTYPFTNDCHRVENGAPTTNVPAPPNQPPDAINAFSMDCLSQFKLGYYFVVQKIHNRRYPVVDQERGIVWAHAIFDQGTVNQGTLSDGRPYTFRGFNRPSSILVTEAFLIEDGKIRRVEMIGPGVPYHMNSPWPGGLSGD